MRTMLRRNISAAGEPVACASACASRARLKNGHVGEALKQEDLPQAWQPSSDCNRMHSELPSRFLAPTRSQWRQSGEKVEAVADVASDRSDKTDCVAGDLDGASSDSLHFFSGGVRWRMLVSSRTCLQDVLRLTEASSCVSSPPSSFATSAGASLSVCIAVIVDSSSWGAEAMQGPGGGELSGNPASEQMIFAAHASVSGCVR